MEYYNSLVAGGDDPGYKDGDYDKAHFNRPMGLAIDGKGQTLFVADTNNNRVRVIHLDEDNRVETLGGNGTSGRTDGPLSLASFAQPSALAWIPPDHLAVYDLGSGLLRSIDLKNKAVTTLGISMDGKTPGFSVGVVCDLVYRKKDNSLYFSQPGDHLLRRMDLKTQKVSTVLTNDPRIPSPWALCVSGDNLYVSEQENSGIFQVDAIPNTTSAQEAVSIGTVGKGELVLELAESDGILYAVQSGNTPLARVSPVYQPINLATPWGFTIDNKNPGTLPLLNFGLNQSVGFTAVPGQARKLIIANPNPWNQAIISVKDYEFDKYWGARSNSDVLGSLADFNYPSQKPPKTFRILIVGNSRVVTAPVIVPDAGKPGVPYDGNGQGVNSLRTNTFPKQLEFILNTQASLQGCEDHFEVLTLGHPGQHVQFFANDEIPPIVKKYDIDLVIAFTVSFGIEGFLEYYLKPLNDEGIPSNKMDPEFLLKTWKEKMPFGAPTRLFERAKAKGLAHVDTPTQVGFSYFSGLIASGDKEIREDLIEMIGKPYKLISERIGSIQRPGENHPKFLMCFCPSVDNDGLKVEEYDSFWRDLCSRNGINLLDLTDPLNGLKTSYYPTSESCCHNHFTAYGNLLIATLLSYYLPQEKWIPWDASSASKATSQK
jgi:sugar lactone lactonase YvrE